MQTVSRFSMAFVIFAGALVAGCATTETSTVMEYEIVGKLQVFMEFGAIYF